MTRRACIRGFFPGHDVVCAADWPIDPGDEEILSRAARERRILITLDKDELMSKLFGDR